MNLKPHYSLPFRADRLEDYDSHNPETNRLVRLETKLSKLLKHFGLDPVTGDPVAPQHPCTCGDRHGR